MRLGFDIDEVVTDITGSMLEFMYNEYKITRSISVFDKYGIGECRYVFEDGMNEEIGKQLWRLVQSNKFLSGLRPVCGAVDSINTLHSQGHEVHFITSRPDKNKDVTYEWFDKYKIHYDNIVVTNGVSKGDTVNNLELEIFVDDHGDYLDDILDVNKIKTKLFLLDKPWNVWYNNRKVKRVLNWNQILGEIDECTRTDKRWYDKSV